MPVLFLILHFVMKKKDKLIKKLMVGIIDYSIFLHYAKEVSNEIVDKDDYGGDNIILNGLNFNIYNNRRHYLF